MKQETDQYLWLDTENFRPNIPFFKCYTLQIMQHNGEADIY